MASVPAWLPVRQQGRAGTIPRKPMEYISHLNMCRVLVIASRSSRLQEAELELVDTSVCESIYVREGYEPQLKLIYPQLIQNRDVICAAHPERDACEVSFLFFFSSYNISG